MNIAARLYADLQQDFGLEPHQAAAVVGNLAHESGGFRQMQEVNPLIPGSRGGYGYAQWTGPRRIAFEDWSNRQGIDPNSYEANYGFLKHELTATPESRVLEQLKQAPDPATATQVFMQGYLRPGIPGLDSRLKWTSRVLGGEPIGTPSVGGLKIGATPPATPAGERRGRRPVLRGASRADGGADPETAAAGRADHAAQARAGLRRRCASIPPETTVIRHARRCNLVVADSGGERNG